MMPMDKKSRSKGCNAKKISGNFIEGEVSFYGLEGIGNKLDGIIDDLNLKDQYFLIKLIMAEAVTNAFVHGNKGDSNKPICLSYKLKDTSLTIEVVDCGCGNKDVSIPKKINENDLLNEGGRGLFLINNYTDEVHFKNNSIIMKKYVNKEVCL